MCIPVGEREPPGRCRCGACHVGGEVMSTTLSPARGELDRLLGRGSPSRRLLVRRIELFVGIGVALGALHLAAKRSGGDHVALTAMLASLIPVFAPLCFVPVVFVARDRGHAPGSVIAVRMSVVALLGATVAAVHLVVWEVLAVSTGTIAGPTAGDIPFSAVAVVTTTGVVAAAYQIPRRRHWAQPVTLLAAVGLYVASFVVHGTVLTPTLSDIRHRFAGGPLAIEVVAALAALGSVALLLRREVHDGIRHAPALPGDPASAPSDPAAAQ